MHSVVTKAATSIQGLSVAHSKGYVANIVPVTATALGTEEQPFLRKRKTEKAATGQLLFFPWWLAWIRPGT
jgi:hypothetical protein